LERLHHGGAPVQQPVEWGAWMRPIVVPMAGWSRVGVGRWLMNDMRADARDDHEEQTQQSLDARRSDKAARIRAKEVRNERRARRDALMLRGKKVKSALRTARYRTAMAVYRGLGRDESKLKPQDSKE
jgi:hypothetical protein